MLTRYGRPDGQLLPEKARCISYHPGRDEYIGVAKPWPKARGRRIDILDQTKLLVLIPEPPRPQRGVDYDPDTHKVERVVVNDADLEERRIEWNIVPLDAQELAEVTVRDERSARTKAVLGDIRGIRNGTGPTARRLQRLEAAVDLLIREVSGIE